MNNYVEKPNISGSKININYEGLFTLKLLMKINVEKPNVNKKKNRNCQDALLSFAIVLRITKANLR